MVPIIAIGLLAVIMIIVSVTVFPSDNAYECTGVVPNSVSASPLNVYWNTVVSVPCIHGTSALVTCTQNNSNFAFTVLSACKTQLTSEPCSGENGKNTQRISGVWVNANGGDIIAGTGFSGIPAMDFIFLSSFNPDPRVSNCSTAQNNDPIAPGGDTAYLKSQIDTIKHYAPGTPKIMISVGGSSFGEPDFCNMLSPFLDSSQFSCAGGGGGSSPGPCGDSAGYTNNTTCTFNDTATQPAFNGTNWGTECAPNALCYCCCNYGFLLTNSTCTKTGPPPPPGPKSSCDYALYPNTTLGNAKLMSDILAHSGADGFDFDFERPDPDGYIAVAFIPFVRALKAAAAPRKIYISMTLLSGPTYADSYGALYECFKSPDCPIDYAVPMPYQNCMYPYKNDKIYKDVWNATTQDYNPHTIELPFPGFTWNGLMDSWTQTYFTDVSNTQLIMAVETLQHDDWYPCTLDFTGIARVFHDYTENVLPSACTHVAGLFFFWYEGLTAPLKVAAAPMYNSSLTSALILEWQRLISNQPSITKPVTSGFFLLTWNWVLIWVLFAVLQL